VYILFSTFEQYFSITISLLNLKTMKRVCIVVLVLAIAMLFPKSNVFSQKEFKGNKTATSKEEDTKLKESFRAHKVFEIDFSEIKNHVYSAKRSKEPKRFTLNVEDEKFSFTLFENDVLSDDFVLIETGKVVARKPKEISTYSGYVGDNPKNALRYPYLVTSTKGSDILDEFTSRNIFAGYNVNVSHLLSGRMMGIECCMK
jgi:hypothetical protein